MNSGTAIHRIVSGLDAITPPLKLKRRTRVRSRALMVTGVRKWRNFLSNHSLPFAAMIHRRERYAAASGRAT